MTTASVCVLLSTYNGAAYLPAQLESLKSQQGVKTLLRVRDDGSSDETIAVLARYADTWPQLASLSSGPNLGPAASFLELLRTAPADADFYAFCDQDDVWAPDKLAAAAAGLAAEAGPALYCSNVTCVGEDLTVLGVPFQRDDISVRRLLFENFAYGCTIVINRACRDLIVARLPKPAAIAMHDWWVTLVVAALGTIRYDPQPRILYRQHGANTVGSMPNAWAEKVGQLRRLLRDPTGYYPIHAQAAELLRLFGPSLRSGDRAAVERLVSSKRSLAARISYAVTGRIVRSGVLGHIVARVLIVAGWY